MEKGRDDAVGAVREAVDIVETVGAVVPLKRDGRNFKALCPFHSEKTPSFKVFPESQRFKCFGCGVGGDVFTFVQMHSRVGFREALEMLAEKTGIQLKRSKQAAARASGRKGLLQLLETACSFYETALRSAEGKPAREYLASREFSEETVRLFRVGWAPRSGRELSAEMTRKGAGAKWLEAASLARTGRDGSHFDFFRGRVTFPIRDPRGKVIAFGARTLGDDEPKYLNSADSPVFSKRRSVFGLDLAAPAVREKGRVVVVEGYTDVMMCHQAGLKETVATLGTAFTDAHAALLSRYADEVVLVFEAVVAGLRAAERAVDGIAAARANARVAVLPEGEDPCDTVRDRGAEAFEELLSSAVPAFDFKLERCVKRHEGEGPRGLAAAAREFMETASLVEDPVERTRHRKSVAEKLGISEADLKFIKPRRAAAKGEEARPSRTSSSAERWLAWYFVRSPEYIERASSVIDLSRLQEPGVKSLVEAARGLKAWTDDAELLAALDDPEAVEIVAEARRELSGAKDKAEIDSEFERVLRDIKVEALELEAAGLRRLAREKKDQGLNEESRAMSEKFAQAQARIHQIRAGKMPRLTGGTC